MATKNAETAGTKATAPEAPAAEPVIIDLGKQRKDRVKKLRKGRGRLMAEVEHAVQELAAHGVVDAGARPVIVVVREKPELGWPFD